jgi:iron complex outermembrane receptor protein
MYYSDLYYVRQDFAPGGTQDSFTKWDARVGVLAENNSWEISLVGRNLTDELTIQHAYEIAGDQFQNLGGGRTITLEAALHF